MAAKSATLPETGITVSTLSTFLKDRDKFEKEYGSNDGPPARKRIRGANFNDVDKAVYKWFLR